MNDPDVEALKRLTIHFKTKEDELRGFEILLDSGMPTFSTTGNRYVVNGLQCKMLREENIQYVCE